MRPTAIGRDRNRAFPGLHLPACLVVRRCVFALLCVAALVNPVSAKSCHDSTTVGKWFDGGVVADNPDGSDYLADSGSILQLGCTLLLGRHYPYTANVSLGYRYQLDNSGEGGNSGWSLETSLAAKQGALVFGGGARYQFNSRVLDFYGLKTALKPSLGGFVYVGFQLGRNLELQFRRHYLTLESESGESFDSSAYGVFLHRSL